MALPLSCIVFFNRDFCSLAVCKDGYRMISWLISGRRSFLAGGVLCARVSEKQRRDAVTSPGEDL